MYNQNYYNDPVQQQPGYYDREKEKKTARLIIIGVVSFLTVAGIVILGPAIYRRIVREKTRELNIGKNRISVDAEMYGTFTAYESGYYSFLAPEGSGVSLTGMTYGDKNIEIAGISYSGGNSFSVTYYCKSGVQLKLELSGTSRTATAIYVNRVEVLAEGTNEIKFVGDTIYPLCPDDIGTYMYTITPADVSASFMNNGDISESGNSGEFTSNSGVSGFLIVHTDAENGTSAAVTITKAEEISSVKENITSDTGLVFTVPEDGYYHFRCDGEATVTVDDCEMVSNYSDYSNYTLDYVDEYSEGDTVVIMVSDIENSVDLRVSEAGYGYCNAFTEYCSYRSSKLSFSSEMLYYSHYSSSDSVNVSGTHAPVGFYYDDSSGALWLAFKANSNGINKFLLWYKV